MRALIVAALLVAAPAAGQRQADPLWVLLQAPDRLDQDREDDKTRNPLELLRFLGIKPGWKTAELGAGGGYTTELLARAVGPKGKVYSTNNQFVRDKFPDVVKFWEKRLERPVMKNSVGLAREFDDPLPPEAKGLDLVVIAFLYHDTVWFGTDRARMNKAIFAALKPGGLYVILDHAGRDGTGVTEVKTLHRIEEKAVVDEITAAGFKLAKRGDFLRNPEDPRDGNVFGPIRGKTDRFVLAFTKPR